MTSTDVAITTINSLLDPRISQVIGSTPESLKDSVTRSLLERDSALGSKFIALAVYSASVKKSVAEEFFISKELEDLRVKITNTFVLNGKLNMTAMTLAGHCFTLVPAISSVKYIIEFKKKIGGENIWDADLSKGSASEQMKKIMEQKAKLHTKAKCQEFALWFIGHTGIAKAAVAKPVKTPGLGAALGEETSAVTISADIPTELVEDWLIASGKSESELAVAISKFGTDRTIKLMEREIARGKGGDTSTTIGGGSTI
jgi:hypothetical protein